MGIPAYFRWISERYPKMMVNCVEFVDYDADTGTERRIDASKANPNGQEFDNLYLDMNGIIHPCTHPEDGPAPTTEEEMFEAVCAYIDRIFGIVRPRRLLYMAIDGVAPRAKINQQRSRRFRSAREAEEKAAEKIHLREEWRAMGLRVKEEDPDAPPPFDSNVITPGTPFMSRLAIALRKYVADRISKDPAWKNLRVLFSDASVPGEGEHKIAEFIRVERAQKGYNPGIKHVMYGLDADLIMLALTTHEVCFTILREEVFPKHRNNHGKGPGGSAADPRHGHNNRQQQEVVQIDSTLDPQFRAVMEQDGLKTRTDIGHRKPFHFLHVNILREYLDIEYRTDILKELESVPDTEVVYNLERVIDDFVFLCFFVGNDFLPHLPTLDIREGAVDFLIELYKTELPRVGYLTSDGGNVDFARVRKMLGPIGFKEDEIFKDRSQREAENKKRKEQREREAKEAEARRKQQEITSTAFGGQKFDKRGRRIGTTLAPEGEPMVALGRKDKNARVGTGEANAAAAAALRKALAKPDRSKKQSDVSSPGIKRKKPDSDDVKPKSLNISGDPSKRKKGETAGDSAEVNTESMVEKSAAEFSEELHQRMRTKNEIKNPQDNIKLGEEGWKDRYYEKKFGWKPTDTAEKDKLLRSYLEGLYWVMKYYYVGCVSWGWYYPYHYAPFASDLVESSILSSDINLGLGKPFKPFSQLQAVMPACSGKLVLPKCYSDLMTNPTSPILDYYPETFDLDLNGKRFAWQGVALLPFIDEKRLNDAIANLDHLLTDEERKRNSFGECNIIVSPSEPLGKFISSLSGDQLLQIPMDIAQGLFFGSVSPALGDASLAALAAVFRLPSYVPHSSALLPTAVAPAAVLDNVTRSGIMCGGWRAARHGLLGQAARELSDKRYGRSGKRHSGRRGRGGPYRGNGGQRTGQPYPHPVASAMFGGLGTQYGGQYGAQQGGQQQYWMQQQGHYQQQQRGGYGPPRQQHRPRQQHGYVPPQRRGGQGGHHGGWQQQQQQGYGGGAYGGYAGQQQYQHPLSQGAYYQQNGYGAPFVPGNYAAQQGHHAQQAQHYPPAGGGLAGPTAANLRQSSFSRGRGRGRGRRGGNHHSG